MPLLPLKVCSTAKAGSAACLAVRSDQVTADTCHVDEALVDGHHLGADELDAKSISDPKGSVRADVDGGTVSCTSAHSQRPWRTPSA